MVPSSVDLERASRDELLDHIRMQRALIRALYEKIVALENEPQPHASSRYQPEDCDLLLDGVPSVAPTSSGAIEPTHADMSTAAEVLSPNTQRNLAVELRNVQAILHGAEVRDLPPQTVGQLAEAERQLIQMLRDSATVVPSTAVFASSAKQAPRSVAAVPSLHEHRPLVAPAPPVGNRSAVEAFRDERLAAALNVQSLGLAAQYTPPRPLPRSFGAEPQAAVGASSDFATPASMSKLEAFRRRRGEHSPRQATGIPPQPSRGNYGDASYERQYTMLAPASRSRPLADATANPSSPPRRGFTTAPPLMGPSVVGPSSPQFGSPRQLQDRIRSRMDAVAPTPPQRVNSSAQRRPRW
jgi:hypothetical protein